MRAWLLALTAVLALAGAAPLGFDHDTHEGKVLVAGKDPVACVACHPIARTGRGVLVGRPGHAACFGACHGAAPKAGVATPPEEEEVCASCHAADDLAARRTAVAYPPYRLDPDFGMTMSHAAHTAVTACGTCHRTRDAGPPATPPRPHARCAGCHDGRAGAAAMTECTTCHLSGFGTNASPRLVPGALSVGEAFGHRKHAARAPGPTTPRDGLDCAGCHRGIATATALELPAPGKASCALAGCHDGTAAFATTVSCRRCHTSAPTVAAPVVRPDQRFSHQAHADRLGINGCAGCHGLDDKGEPRSAGHAACTGCHAADFADKKPRYCGACHASTEPWRGLTVDRMPPATSDFGAHIDHARHASVTCERCHSLDTAARQLRPARGHVACSAPGCHAVRGGPSPTLMACSACHRIGLERGHADERLAAPWSVRARFRHDMHNSDRDGDALACTACHTTATTPAETPAAVTMPPPPAKASCAPCHDGRAAFKMSGHGCARCHGD